MANQLPPFLKHYDRLAAVLVLVALLISLAFLVLKGVSLQQEVSEYNADLEAGQPSTSQVKPADNAADLALIAVVANPPAEKLLVLQDNPEAANLGTPERRLLCVKCTKPIVWGADKCTFCGATQPKEEKIDLAAVDSDGDGIPDIEELKLKLDPQNGNDVDLDNDADGFTNIEEYLAKTDMNDAKSHPSYEGRFSVKKIEGTKLQIRATNAMQLPSTKDAEGKEVPHYKVTFVAVNANGVMGTKTVSVKDGEEIKPEDGPSTGFKFVRYIKRDKKKIEVGEHKQIRYVDVSEVELERMADAKKVITVMYDKNNTSWPDDPLIEQRATLGFDIPGVKDEVVAPGSKFAVKGVKYTVLSVNAEKNVVTIQKNATEEKFDLK